MAGVFKNVKLEPIVTYTLFQFLGKSFKLSSKHGRKDAHAAIRGHDSVQVALPSVHGHDPDLRGIYVEMCDQVCHPDLAALQVQFQLGCQVLPQPAENPDLDHRRLEG